MLTGSVVALNDDPIEYSVRLEQGGWTIFNLVTLEPVIYRGVRMARLLEHEADDLVDMLNAMERAGKGSSITWADDSR